MWIYAKNLLIRDVSVGDVQLIYHNFVLNVLSARRELTTKYDIYN